MPAPTPIYGFTYPCPGELITAGAFTTLANQIDAKLADLQADLTLGLNRYSSYTSSVANQSIPTGVETVLTAAGMSYVIPMAGIWIVRCEVIPQSFPATITVERARIHQNGVFRFGFSQNTEGNSTRRVVASGPIVAALGDTITVRFLHTGSVAMDVSGTLTTKMLVRTA